MIMPRVSRCEVTECAYNRDSNCQALAITVGDTTHPRCDTFVIAKEKGGQAGATCGVGACKVSICRNNRSLECQASNINVGYVEDEVDCLTFSPR